MNRTEQIRYAADQIMRGEIDGWLHDHTEEEGDCLLWTGAAVHKNPQPVMTMPRVLPPKPTQSRVVPAKQVIWESFKGMRMCSGFRIYSSCGNSLCVNPDHLRRIVESQSRRFSRGTAGHTKTTIEKIRLVAQSRSPLTLEIAQTIREEMAKIKRGVSVKTGKHTCRIEYPSGIGREERMRQLAAQYGVSTRTIEHVLGGKRWPLVQSVGMFSQLLAANDNQSKRRA